VANLIQSSELKPGDTNRAGIESSGSEFKSLSRPAQGFTATAGHGFLSDNLLVGFARDWDSFFVTQRKLIVLDALRCGRRSLD